ncbi:hypothetical protein Lalb_Chr01g0011131 [Lupinus albus]|uniref:Uncharacterized protein n=1 Tax=Lupinus albus TaxID=3870 RepID=A0A6A4R535_LUPAL|nr:hypothetical protein Lalb_Chr01g0011131 [Lupinus albus]
MVKQATILTILSNLYPNHGSLISWISIILFCMVNSMSLFICINLWVFEILFIQTMFFFRINLYMLSNRLLVSRINDLLNMSPP